LSSSIQLQPVPDEPKPHETYEAFRSYVRHEDSLVNSRLSWNLTVQGFLFAGYGVLAQKAFEFCADGKTPIGPFNSLRSTMLVLGLLGVMISLTSFVGICAANMATRKVRKQWQAKIDASPKLKGLFPALTGGGARGAEAAGQIPQFFLPVLFILAWLGIFWASHSLTECPVGAKSGSASSTQTQCLGSTHKP